MRKFKRFVAALSLCAMAMSLIACGDSDEKETTTEEVTTEATTEEVTTEATTEETSEETSEDAATDGDASSIEVDDNGMATLLGVSFKVPEGYEYSEDDSAEGSATFVNYSKAGALVIGVDNQNTVLDESTVIDTFDAQIKIPYGENVTYSSVTYNGHAATEWVLDNEEGGYVGRSLVIADGSTLIYIEFVSYEGDLSPYDEMVNSLEY